MSDERDAPRERRDPLIGEAIAGRYVVGDLIARGGMARVYRARDERLDRAVAVKVLSAPYADDPAASERFLAEARAAASLSHPSLVHVYDSGSDGAAHYIVMELLDRHRSLRDELDARGPLPRSEVLRMARELLGGLRVVHDRELVHCDVKSGNIMLGPGPAKLIDFGIARSPRDATDGDTSIGSLQYMSPEQLHGEPLTPASDLFSLGVVLYEALTGRLPYPGSTPDEVIAAHRAGTVQPPSALGAGSGARMDDAILQALQRDPGARFRSAEAMAQALASAADELGRDDDTTRVVAVPARDRGAYVPPPAERSVPPPAPRQAPPSSRRRRSLWNLVGALFIVAAAALVVIFVVVPLLQLGGGGGQDGASPTSAPTAQPGTVLVPQTVGLPTRDAIEAASAVGLDWTVRCNEDPSQPEGIIDQEPPADTRVEPGSAFTMFSARISDCR